MHKEYILLNGFRKAKKDFTAGFHVPLSIRTTKFWRTLKLLEKLRPREIHTGHDN